MPKVAQTSEQKKKMVVANSFAINVFEHYIDSNPKAKQPGDAGATERGRARAWIIKLQRDIERLTSGPSAGKLTDAF